MGIKSAVRKGVQPWKENGRLYKLESLKNDTGKFLSCSVTDREGKRHKLFIPKGRDLMAAKLRELGG